MSSSEPLSQQSGSPLHGDTDAAVHETYADPVDGGWNGYQAACHTCDWRAEKVHKSKLKAQEEAAIHAAEKPDHGEASAAIVAGLLRQAQDDYQSIDNLGREVSRLREALNEIVGHSAKGTPCDASCADEMIRVAREALA